MNRLLLLLLAALPYCLSAQVIEYNNETFALFTLKHPLLEGAPGTGIDWQHENLYAEFELKGKNRMHYSLHPVNDSTVVLSREILTKWHIEQTIYHSGWALNRINEDGTIISEFKITDFDHDGDQDLTCLRGININGNSWTLVYLNDEKSAMLVKLMNTAESTDIWDDPRYEPETGLIHTELYSGAYGIQNTATYRLNGTTAESLSMEEIDMTNPDYIINTTYKGENGMWKKVAETREDIVYEDGGEANGWVNLEQEGYIMFDFEPLFDADGALDFSNQEVYAVFSPKGTTPATYRLNVVDNNTVVLLQQEGSNWVPLDTLSCNTDNWDVMEGRPLVSTFKVTDFNHDGSEDLVCYGINGGQNVLSAQIYINNPQTGRLNKLFNPVGATYLWHNPDYTPDTQILTTWVSGWLEGIETIIAYRLENATAVPLTKTEIDRANPDNLTERTYTYKKGKWKLVKSRK